MLLSGPVQPLSDLLWTPALAEAIAKEDGVGALTEKHWRVIGFCREESARRGKAPTLSQIVRHSGLDAIALAMLFGPEPRDEALRIAGIAGRTSPRNSKKGPHK